MLTIPRRDVIPLTMKPRNPLIDRDRAEEILQALGQQLQASDATYELVVIGGTAMQVLGFIQRPTRDVDVVGLLEGPSIVPADPLPEPLVDAAERVAIDFGLPANWLNAGPADLARQGLPEGFQVRWQTRSFGQNLTVHFAGRLDQIHLKLYAMVDQGSGRHETDLRARDPTTEELRMAARWTRTHDPSPGFREVLLAVLKHLGVPDADVGP